MLIALLASAVSGIVIPMLTDLVTKLSAPDWLRSVLNGALSVVAGIAATAAATDDSGAVESLTAIIVAWLASGRSHQAGISQPIAKRTQRIGIGR